MNKIYKGYCRVEEVIVGIGLSLIVALTFTNAILRLFDHPIVSVDDISKLLFSWSAFLGADVALRHSRLVGMDIVVKKFPIRVQKIVAIIVHIIMILLLLVLTVNAFKSVPWARPFYTLGISFGTVYISVPVCAILMIFTCIIRIFKIASHFTDDEYSLKKDNPDAIFTKIKSRLSQAPAAEQKGE